MLRKLVFGLGAIEAAILLGFLVQYHLDPPGAAGSGGPQMALFFFVLLPMLPLSIAFLLLIFGRRSRVATGIATLIIAFPLLALAYVGVRNVRISLASAELRSGRGYFTDPAARLLGEAVVNKDLPVVTRLAAATDVNARGRSDMTFLKLAIADAGFDIRIAHILLAAGANPNDDAAWPVSIAIYHGSAPLLASVLAAGGDPNIPSTYGTPVFFGATRQPELIPQLLAGGARIEATDGGGRTMLLHAIYYENWDAALVLLAHGANRNATDRDGKGALDLLQQARQRIRDNGRPIAPGLLTLEAKLHERQ